MRLPKNLAGKLRIVSLCICVCVGGIAYALLDNERRLGACLRLVIGRMQPIDCRGYAIRPIAYAQCIH